MNIELIHKPAFFAVGIEINTSSATESHTETALIPGLWQQYFSETVDSQIVNKLEGSSILGIYWNYDKENEKTFSVLAGREVASLSSIPGELTGIEVPESDYLVFSADGDMPQIIYSLWESIRQYFSDNNLYHRKYSYDFECYNSDNTSNLDIYIAVEAD